MMATAPRRRGPPQPTDMSRAAGAPAPASAAATAPRASGFYTPGSAPSAEGEATSMLAHVRETGVPLGDGLGADPETVAIADHAGGDLQSEIQRIRSLRRPLGAYSQKLALATRPGYHRHWFNDTAGRIEDAEANGWTHVKGKDGLPIKRCVGTGRDNGALFAYAMEIPEVFWLEDQDARHAAATAKIDGIKKSPFQAPPGAAKSSDKGKFYDPSETDAGPLQVVKS